MSRLVVGPFNRVEGDLEIKLDVENGAVAAAYINSPLYRGFEQILLGKAPADALVYAPRICGICSVSQSLAAAHALAKAQGLTPPENGARLQNLILAAENRGRSPDAFLHVLHAGFRAKRFMPASPGLRLRRAFGPWADRRNANSFRPARPCCTSWGLWPGTGRIRSACSREARRVPSDGRCRRG